MLNISANSLTTENADVAEGKPLKPIQFVDLKAQQALIREEIDARIAGVLDHGMYINGPEHDELEKALAERTGAADVVLCGNGTEALEIAMMGKGIGVGDAVFIPGFTYNATASAVLMVGATPVFVDVREDTRNIDPDDLERRIKAVLDKGELSPKMVIPVDLFGLPADYLAIQKVANKYQLAVLADGAQAFGGRQNGKWVGNIAPMTTTSFFPAKSLGCYGDGGAIFAQSKEQADIWRSIRWHGTDTLKRESIRLGTNGRFDTLQAAVILTKLKIFDKELVRRREISEIYLDRLRDYVELPIEPENTQSGWGYFGITLDNRDEVKEKLSEVEVPSAIYYQIPLHQMEAFHQFAPKGGLPNCERLSQRILHLPIDPYLSDGQVDYICRSLIEAVG